MILEIKKGGRMIRFDKSQSVALVVLGGRKVVRRVIKPGRAELLLDFTIDAFGKILDSWAWAGYPLWAVFLWDRVMDDCVDDYECDGSDDPVVNVFHIGDSEIVEFPELAAFSVVKLWADDDGFVCFKGFV